MPSLDDYYADQPAPEFSVGPRSEFQTGQSREDSVLARVQQAMGLISGVGGVVGAAAGTVPAMLTEAGKTVATRGAMSAGENMFRRFSEEAAQAGVDAEKNALTTMGLELITDPQKRADALRALLSGIGNGIGTAGGAIQRGGAAVRDTLFPPAGAAEPARHTTQGAFDQQNELRKALVQERIYQQQRANPQPGTLPNQGTPVPNAPYVSPFGTKPMTDEEYAAERRRNPR